MHSLLARPGLALALVVILGLALRFGLVLTHDNYLGVDGGAYLLSRNDVMGSEPTGTIGPGLPRPPLAPGYQLVPFTILLGDDVGYKVWTVLASMAPVFAVYLLCRMFLSRWASVGAAGFVSLDLLHAEMMVTGALPLLGFSLIAVALWCIATLGSRHGRHDWRFGFLLAGCIPLIAFVNQTSAGLAAILIPAYLGGVVFYTRDRRILWHTLPWLALGGALALTALPWYIGNLPGSDAVRYPGPWLYLSNWASSAWWQFVIAVPVGWLVIRKARSPRLRSLGLVTVLLGVLLVFMSTDEAIINIFYRSRYMVTIPLFVCLGWLVARYWWPLATPRWAGYLAMFGIALVLVAGYVFQFKNQAQYSDMITVATANVLEAIDGEAQGIVTNTYTLSLWIAALERVPSPWAFTHEPPDAFVAMDQDVRCVLNWVAGCDGRLAANRLGVSHVLIDTRFPDYNGRAPANYKAPPDQWNVTASAPWLSQVYSRGSTQLWLIGE